jgi:hypothetical protein
VVKPNSLNPAYRQAGTKDHKVRHKVARRKKALRIHFFNSSLKIKVINMLSPSPPGEGFRERWI